MGFFDLFKKKKVEEQQVEGVRTPEEVEAQTVREAEAAKAEVEAERKELEAGLEKTKEGFFGKLKRAIAGRTTVDADVLDDLEEVLITSDVGVDTTVKIIRAIEERVARDTYMNTVQHRASPLSGHSFGSKARRCALDL